MSQHGTRLVSLPRSCSPLGNGEAHYLRAVPLLPYCSRVGWRCTLPTLSWWASPCSVFPHSFCSEEDGTIYQSERTTIQGGQTIIVLSAQIMHHNQLPATVNRSMKNVDSGVPQCLSASTNGASFVRVAVQRSPHSTGQDIACCEFFDVIDCCARHGFFLPVELSRANLSASADQD